MHPIHASLDRIVGYRICDHQSAGMRAISQPAKADLRSACSKAGLRSSGGRAIDVAKTHLQPHLVVGDVENASALRQWSNARAIYSVTAAMHASNRCTTRFCHISALVLPRFAPLSDGCFALV